MIFRYVLIFMSVFTFCTYSPCFAGKDKKEKNNSEGSSVQRKPSMNFLFWQNVLKSKNSLSQTSNDGRGSMPAPSSPIRSTKVNFKRSSAPLPEKPTKFAQENLDRLQDYKGLSAQDALAKQLGSEDWYTRNFARCFKALMVRNSNPQDAEELIVTSHEEGYAPASFELARLALRQDNIEDANKYLDVACQNTRVREKEYDDQALSELSKSICIFVKRNPSLQEIFRHYEQDPLFQEKEKKEKEINEKLVKAFGEKDEDFMKGLSLSSENPERKASNVKVSEKEEAKLKSPLRPSHLDMKEKAINLEDLRSKLERFNLQLGTDTGKENRAPSPDPFASFSDEE